MTGTDTVAGDEILGDVGRLASDAVEELRTVMSLEAGSAWQQVLLPFRMPGPAFAAAFEHDRPDRWSLGGYGAEGVASFAEQVDPARAAGRGG